MKEIKLTNSDRLAIIDDDDFERVSSHNWWMNGPGYVSTSIKGKDVFMHNFVMGVVEGKEIDHINQIKIDNRKENLRHLTHLENVVRIGIRKNNSTGYVGVCSRGVGKLYRAYIRFQGKQIFLGNYKTPEEAAIRYNEAATKHFGEFAYLNIVEAQ